MLDRPFNKAIVFQRKCRFQELQRHKAYLLAPQETQWDHHQDAFVYGAPFAQHDKGLVESILGPTLCFIWIVAR